MKPKKTIIIAGSKGIGKGIYKHLKKISESTIALSSKDFDTSNIENANKFVKKYKSADVLVLNTGGPPPTNFYKISNEEWLYYFNQLFLSFAIILRDFKIKKNGFIFLISSFHIREINPKLVISNSLRIAFWSLLKSLTETYAEKNITTINIAPGPIDTDRIRKLNKDIKTLQSKLPLKRLGTTDEIGELVKNIVLKDIKYVNGTTIFVDGGKSKSLF
jgi:3-oxoacyl-[acyl-carrier protein] reductase